MDEPLDRPSWACQTCPPPKGGAWTQADGRNATCDQCYDRIRANLEEVAERYLLLDPRPEATIRWRGRGSPGFVSRPPVSVHIVSMRDPRSTSEARVWVGGDGRVHQEETRPPQSTYGVLHALAWAIAGHRRDIRGEATSPGDRDDVFALVRYIDTAVGYLTKYAELAVEVDARLRDLLAGMRPVTGANRRKIGPCPQMVDRVLDDDITADPVKVRCDTPLYTSPKLDEDTVVCSGCGHSWQMDRWITLGDESDLESAS